MILLEKILCHRFSIEYIYYINAIKRYNEVYEKKYLFLNEIVLLTLWNLDDLSEEIIINFIKYLINALQLFFKKFRNSHYIVKFLEYFIYF